MMPAVWWNLAAWLAWGILIVSWRYAVEYRLQSAEQQASLDALEVSR
jgi:heme exporter protein C